MDEKLKVLQEEIDKAISQDDYFKEQDKRRIRNGIREMKSGASTKRFILLPKLLTAISICAFFVVLGGFIGKEIGFFASDPPQEVEPPVAEPPVTVPNEEHVEHENIDNFIWNSYTIETGQAEVHYQDIKGNTVIWSGSDKVPDSDSSSFDFDLFVYNLKMERFDETFQSEIGGEITEGQVNDEWITWVDSGSVEDEYEWRIYALNRNTKEKFLIRYSNQVAGYANPHVVNPQLSMSTGTNHLTWVEPVEGEDKVVIQLYDLDTRELLTVDESSNMETIPQLSDDYLVWSSHDIEFVNYSLVRKKVDSKFVNKFELMFLKVNDEYIVRQEKTRTSETRLVAKPVQFYKEYELFTGDINSFDIGDNFVIWESDRKIYIHSLLRKETKVIGEGKFPSIRGNMAIWQLPKEAGEDSAFRVVEFRAPELTDVEYGKLIDTDLFEQREIRIESEIEIALAREDLFQSKLKDTLNGAYMDESGVVVVDFAHFGELIGVPSWEERGDLMAALNEAVFKNPKANKIYYLFDGDYIAFGDWTEFVNVYIR